MNTEKAVKFEGKHADLTEKVLEAFFEVYGELGYGFTEKVYRNALAIVLRDKGLKTETEKEIQVLFRGAVIGEYRVDLLVEDKIIIELKAAAALAVEHEAQLLNYLKATPIEVGLLLNFGPKPSSKRRVFDNTRKKPAARSNWHPPSKP